MSCTNCGKTVDVDSKFCIHCGQKIDQTSPQSANKSEAQESRTTLFENNSELLRQAKRKEAIGEIVTGLLLLGIGGGITWYGYSSTSAGGTYTVFWGLIIYGAYRTLKGFGGLFS